MTPERIKALKEGLNIRMKYVDDPAWTTSEALDLIDYVRELENAIRKHRDERGDNRCWLDDHCLYEVLPEGYTPPKEDTCVELERCKAFIASRHDPAVKYVSPQERIEELEKQVEELKRQLNSWGGVDL